MDGRSGRSRTIVAAAGRYRLLAMGIFCLCLCLVPGGCGRKERDQEAEILFLHNNPCEACDEKGRFLEVLEECAPGEGLADSCEVLSYYAYGEQGRRLAEQTAERFGLEKSEIIYPIVVVGDVCLLGYDQIRHEIRQCLERFRKEGNQGTDEEGYDGQTAVWKADSGRDPAGHAGENRILDAGMDVIHLLYFHTEICSKCEKAEEFLEQLPDSIVIGEKEYPVVITRLSVAEEANALYFGALAAQRDVPEREQQVPFLFLGDAYLSGEVKIRQQTRELLETGAGINAVYQADDSGELSGQEESPVLFLLKTVGVGFLNGFNPCALSLVLLFFSLMASLPKGLMRHGMIFLAGKFAAYVLLGMAAASAFSAIPFGSFLMLRRGVNGILILFCICLAVGNFLDCYHAFRGEYGKVKVQLPGKMRRWNDTLVKKISAGSGKKVFLLVIFGGSMLVALGEFFCTGQIYLAFVLQWIQRAEGSGIPVLALVLYSGALCLPALALLLFMRQGKSAVALANKSLKQMPLIKLCNGILFVVFAVLALSYL